MEVKVAYHAQSVHTAGRSILADLATKLRSHMGSSMHNAGDKQAAAQSFIDDAGTTLGNTVSQITAPISNLAQSAVSTASSKAQGFVTTISSPI